MCLDLNKDAKRQTAAEDIICYKQLIHKPDLTSYKGKSFTGIIKGIACEGKIQMEYSIAFFCTDNPELSGWSCDNKLGYQYSCVFCSDMKSIIVDGVELMTLTEDSMFVTPYRFAKVKLGETYTSYLIREDDKIYIGLHSFTTYEDARNDGFGVVVKCIIPKGAEYYEGKFYGRKSYASTQLKYLEIIEE